MYLVSTHLRLKNILSTTLSLLLPKPTYSFIRDKQQEKTTSQHQKLSIIHVGQQQISKKKTTWLFNRIMTNQTRFNGAMKEILVVWYL